MFSTAEFPSDFPQVLTEGSHPFDEREFRGFLAAHGCRAFGLDHFHLAYTTLGPHLVLHGILVVGHEGYSEERLGDLVDWYSGRTLRVYSQEMMLSFLACGRDPFDGPRDLLVRFGMGHSALEYLAGLGFDWPSTVVSRRGGTGITLDPPPPGVGLLKHMGYSVGRDGVEDTNQRQMILGGVFFVHLPDARSPSDSAYLAQWGSPQSARRLQKMAECIATFCCLQKRKTNPSTISVVRWEADLEWLKNTLYRGRFTFQWPSTDVG